jgi:peptidoglycan/LPS O-acetylase OafA/YrhL
MEFRRDINGLRALAVFLVVLYHFEVPGVSGGFIGVDVFFVVSGYLMTRIICERIDAGRFSVWGFYFDRGSRIIPALLALCTALLAFGWVFLPPLDYADLGKRVAASVGFVSNVLYWRESGYFGDTARENWLLHTWSLSVEWQFYVLYPLGMAAIARWHPQARRGAVLGATVLSFALAVFVSTRWSVAGFFLLPTRAWEMLAGGIVFLLPAPAVAWRKPAHLVGLSMIIAGAVLIDASKAWPAWWTLLPVLGTAMVIASASDSPLTSNPAVQILGKISYSVYLWHWPIVVGVGYLGAQGRAPVALGMAASIALGWASYAAVENPGRRWLRGMSGLLRPVGALVLVPMAVVLCGGGLLQTAGLPGRVDAAVRLADGERNDFDQKTRACIGNDGIELHRCGDSQPTVIVMGDSHSEALFAAVNEAAGGRARMVSYADCPMLPGVRLKLEQSNHHCGGYAEKAYRMIASEQRGIPIVFITRLSFYIWGPSPGEYGLPNEAAMYFDEPTAKVTPEYLAMIGRRVTASLCRLAKTSPVYALLPVPEMGVKVPQRMARELMVHGSQAQDISLPMAEYERRHAAALQIMKNAASACAVRLLDPVPILCHDGRCVGSERGLPLYQDDDHLSLHGARRLAPMFKKALAGGAPAQP